MSEKSDAKGPHNDYDFEVIIIGAGISGINAAYRIQTEAPAGSSYTILEARDRLGGTWDLFRYPGIRSDSDMFTFGFQWNPWPERRTFAQGEEIREYLNSSAKQAGIEPHIQYRHKVVSADWSSAQNTWQVVTRVQGEEKPRIYSSRFVLLGTGYYDYDEPLQTVIPGIGDFQGKVIHPQFWPEEYDYTDKDVVIIGSGATTVSIVPSMATKVKHITMLQRSPTYIFPVPQHSKITGLLFTLLPRAAAHRANRLIWIMVTYLMIVFCNHFPNVARSIIRRVNRAFLPPQVSVDPHFMPAYNPWEQRLCASLDGDIFEAMRTGKAGVVTDTIERVTKDSIRLHSGKTLRPDVIITATGLKLRFAGGIRFTVDGQTVDERTKFLWKACMVQDMPNLIFTIGFENASWTLGADCAALLLTRLMRHMQSQGATVAVPFLDEPDKMPLRPLMSLKATYLKNVDAMVPKASTGVWSPRANYMKDLYAATWGDLQTGLLVK